MDLHMTAEVRFCDATLRHFLFMCYDILGAGIVGLPCLLTQSAVRGICTGIMVVSRVSVTNSRPIRG